jgi:hypothetical protein
MMIRTMSPPRGTGEKAMKMRPWFACVPLLFAGTAMAAGNVVTDAAANGAEAEQQRIAEPSERIDVGVAALRENDFTALLDAISAEPWLDDLQKEWTRAQKRNVEYAALPPEERAKRLDGPPEEIRRVWTRLQSDAGIEELVREWQPLIAEKAQGTVLTMNVGIAAALAKANDEPSAIAPAQQREIMLALQGWANRTDFSDPVRLRRALDAVSREVRATHAKTIDDFVLTDFETALVSGDGLIRAVKGVLKAYDFDADAVLASIRTRDDVIADNKRLTTITSTVLGVTFDWTREFELFEGKWMLAEVAEMHREIASNIAEGGDGVDFDSDVQVDIEFDEMQADARNEDKSAPSIGSCKFDSEKSKQKPSATE